MTNDYINSNCLLLDSRLGIQNHNLTQRNIQKHVWWWLTTIADLYEMINSLIRWTFILSSFVCIYDNHSWDVTSKIKGFMHRRKNENEWHSFFKYNLMLQFLVTLKFEVTQLLSIIFVYLWSNCYHAFWYLFFVTGKTNRTL